MPTIRCPGCGQTEFVDLHGRFLVECDQCKLKFVAVIVRHNPPPPVEVTCPSCGCSESLPLGDSKKVQVTCSYCNYQFVFPQAGCDKPSASG
jgi:ribosomal protein S27E